jgi:hypothetical protein
MKTKIYPLIIVLFILLSTFTIQAEIPLKKVSRETILISSKNVTTMWFAAARISINKSGGNFENINDTGFSRSIGFDFPRIGHVMSTFGLCRLKVVDGPIKIIPIGEKAIILNPGDKLTIFFGWAQYFYLGDNNQIFLCWGHAIGITIEKFA